MRATPGVLLSCWMFTCVLSGESRLHWHGLQRSYRVLSEQREGAERRWTTLFEQRADGGSDSTFQMVDITRITLARGLSSYTSVWNRRLLPFSRSLSTSLLLSPSFKFQTKNTAIHTGGLPGLSLVSFLFLIIHFSWIFIPSQTYWFFLQPLFLLSYFFPSHSPKVAHYFPFWKKKTAYIWLWSSFTFLFLPSQNITIYLTLFPHSPISGAYNSVGSCLVTYLLF